MTEDSILVLKKLFLFLKLVLKNFKRARIRRYLLEAEDKEEFGQEPVQ